MRRLALPLLVLSALSVTSLALTGCGGDSLTRTFGLTRDTPDEFTVTTRAPLSMPPDFSVRPPRPGAPRPQEQSDREQAELALAPQGATTAAPAVGSTTGQQALLDAAGPAASPDIRNKIDQDQQLDRPKQGFADRMMFWQPTPPAGTQIDAAAEQQRLRENAALGKDPTVGSTPVIQPPKKGFLQGLFGWL